MSSETSRWTATSSQWGNRAGHTTITLANGDILLMGGAQNPPGQPSVFFSDIWRSSDGGATWTVVLAAAPWHARQMHASVVLGDNSILLAGGTDWTPMNDVWRGANDGVSWARLTSNAPWAARTGHAMVALSNNVVVLMGGWTAAGVQQDVWRSTTGGQTWQEVQRSGSWWSRRRGMAAVVLAGDVILLMGGHRGGTMPSTLTNEVWRSNNGGFAWTLASTPPWVRRYYHSATLMNDGSILVLGGHTGSFANDVWRSEDGGDRWLQVTSAASWDGRYLHAVTTRANTVVLTGGYRGSGSTYNMQLASDVWSSTNLGATWTSEVLPPRKLAAVVSLTSGAVVVLGGMTEDMSVKFNDVWCSFDLGATWQLVISNAPWDARSSAVPVVLSGDRIVLMGGSAVSNAGRQDVWLSETGGATWSMQSIAPWASRTGHGACAVGNTIIMAGGSSQGNTMMRDVWQSNTAGQQWVHVATAPWAARQRFGLVALSEGTLVMFGGSSSVNVVLRDVWRSSTLGSTWQQVTSSAPWAARVVYAATVLSGDVIALLGGGGPTSQPEGYGDVWISTTKGTSWSWLPASTPWTGTTGFAAVPVEGGLAVMVFGGAVRSGHSNTPWLMACGAGAYTSSSACHPCLAGTASSALLATSSSACVPCPGGHYTTEPGSSSCQTCPAGSTSTSASGSTSCGLCTPGSYALSAGLSSCTPCPAGTATSAWGAASLSACLVCAPGTYSLEGSAGCEPCPPGTHVGESGAMSADQCAPCGYGTYAPEEGTARCLSCPPGTFSNVTGSTSQDDCDNCPVGTFSRAHYDPEEDTGHVWCETCPAGTYNGQEGSMTCAACPMGHYSTQAGATSPSTCNACPAGHFSRDKAAQDATACQACAAGTFSVEHGSTACSACPAGSYNVEDGAIHVDQCVKCPNGTYSDIVGASTADVCQPCPVGTFGVLDGQSGCMPCPTGTFNPSPGAHRESMCLPCGPGYYSVALSGSASCVQCPAGTYGTLERAATKQECTACPAGTFSDSRGARSDASCRRCDKGMYSTAPGSTACESCPLGTYSGTDGATSDDTCLACPHGTFAAQSGMVACSLCPAGTHSPNVGATTGDTCVLCSAGMYAADRGQAQCTPCPPGTMGTAPGATNVTMCTTCPRGTYSNIPGTTVCPECPKTESCLGGNHCARGSGGYLCGECVQGYFPLSGECRRCPTISPVHVTVGICCFVVTALLVKMGVLDLKALSMLTVIASYIQLMFMNFNMHVPWPFFVQVVWRWLRVLIADLGLFSPHCVASIGWHTTLVLTVALGCLIPMLAIVATAGLRKAAAFARFLNKDKEEWRALLEGFAAFAVGAVYIPVLRTLLQTFDCASTPDGSVLRLDVNIRCSSGTHVAAMVASGVLASLMIVVPAVCAVIIHRRTHHFFTVVIPQRVQQQEQLGTDYWNSHYEGELASVRSGWIARFAPLRLAIEAGGRTYKARYPHMYFITQLHKAVSVAAVVLVRSGTAQLIMVLVSGYAYLVFLLSWQPWDAGTAVRQDGQHYVLKFCGWSVPDVLNRAAIASSCMQLLTLSVGLAVLSMGGESDNGALLAKVLGWVSTAMAAGFVLLEFKMLMDNAKRSKQQRRQRRAKAAVEMAPCTPSSAGTHSPAQPAASPHADCVKTSEVKLALAIAPRAGAVLPSAPPMPADRVIIGCVANEVRSPTNNPSAT